MTIPVIDPNVRHVGTSYLRTLNSEKLRQLEGAIVVRDNEEPLAVIVSWETFIALQQQAQAAGVLNNGIDTAVKMIDAVGPSLSQRRGKTPTETRRPLREKGDGKR